LRYWLIVIPLLGAGAFGGYYATTWPGFRVTSVQVAGNRTVSSAVILRRAAIQSERNVWLQNMGAAALRVATIPNVAGVHIARSFPARVRIVVDERVAYAQIVSGARPPVVIDRDLRILTREPSADLPVFRAKLARGNERPGRFLRDPMIAELAREYALLRDGGLPVSTMQLDRFGDLPAIMRSGIRLLLGASDNVPAAIALVKPILEQTASGDRKVAALDLRAPKTPVVVYQR